MPGGDTVLPLGGLGSMRTERHPTGGPMANSGVRGGADEKRELKVDECGQSWVN